MKIFLLSIFAICLTISAQAAPKAAIGNCEGLDSIGNLEYDVLNFSNGSIRVAQISTEEPAASPEHLLIFVADKEMGQDCYAINSTDEGDGFSAIDLQQLKSSYSPAAGLQLTFPIYLYNSEDGGSVYGGTVTVQINRKNKMPVTILN